MRSLIAVVLGVFLMAGSAFAMCGTCGVTCEHGKKGDNASVLNEASAALESSNPELAGKVKAIADKCCAHGLHEGMEHGAHE
jgi:hypothetical protein